MNTEETTDLAPQSGHSDMGKMITSRQTQEVQGAMVIAKKFPRDEIAAIVKIKQACKRPRLAASACYQYPRGNTQVVGPSIRLAEAMAQCWGNLDYGIIELEQRDGESSVMAYCWDLESNTRQTKIFQVPHIRYSKKGGNTLLTDPRDIYEMVANQGARRLRACILGVIPGDVQEDAVEACEATLAGNSDEPLADRALKMVEAFAPFGVTQTDIEARLQLKLKDISERQILDLGKIYNAVKDGIGKKEDFFEAAPAAPAAATGDEGGSSKKPTATQKKKAAAAAKKQEEAEKQAAEKDTDTLVKEALALQELCSEEIWLKVWEEVKLDPAEAVEMLSAAKLQEIIQLVNASM